jgi:hypothetical protein
LVEAESDEKASDDEEAVDADPADGAVVGGEALSLSA